MGCSEISSGPMKKATHCARLHGSFADGRRGKCAFWAVAIRNRGSSAVQELGPHRVEASVEKGYCAEVRVNPRAQDSLRATHNLKPNHHPTIFPVIHKARVLACLVLVAVVAVKTASAAKHPVPLDPKADTSTCLACHEDKSKGKAVHSAIAMGCTTCHEIRVTKDATRVKLTKITPTALCLSCHEDKKAAGIKGTVHSPAVRDCIKCHDPHSSDNKDQLLKAESGGEKENLCLSCHNIGEKVPEKGSRHAALDMGCDSCHVTHKTGEIGKVEFDFHLTKGSPALCLDCHDIKDAKLASAHRNQPFEKADCLTCHDPHQSDAPKLMARFTHPPFADKQCEVCHAPAKDGKVVLAQADAKSLCVSCHDDKAKLIESAKVQHPGAAGDCTDCHNPHASRQSGLPKTDKVNACLSCHSDVADLTKKKVHHQPAFVEGCSTCHEPHGSENLHLLRTSSTNGLCME